MSPRGSRAATAALDREATIAAGYRPERTLAEWVAHPTALGDLLRVLAGTSLHRIDGQRQMARRAARRAS
jgi:hypothetical protein